MLQIYENWLYSALFLLTLLVFSVSLQKKLSLAQTALWAYVVVSSLIPAFSVYYEADYLMPIFLTPAKLAACQSLVLAILVPLFVLISKKKSVGVVLKLLFFIEACAVLITGHTIMFGWSSFSSVMLALSVFLFKPNKNKLETETIAVALIFAASLINLSITTVVIYFYALLILIWKVNKTYVLYLLSLLAAVPFLVDLKEILTGNGRYLMWSQFIQIWNDKLPKVLGTGFGTWEWVGPQLKGSDFMGYAMLHNDYLQVLFEGGFIGLALFLWVIGESFYKHGKNVQFILPAGAFCLAMLSYFPLHVVAGQVLALHYLLYDRD